MKKENKKTPYFDIVNEWFLFQMNNKKVKPAHTSLYLYLVNRFNSSFWVKEMGLPTDRTMEILNIGSYNTYKKALYGIIEFGFITEVRKSKNMSESRIIALSYFDKATDKARDEATDKAVTYQLTKQLTKQLSHSNTYKLLNKETIKLLNNNASLVNDNLEKWILKEVEVQDKVDYPKILEIFNSVCIKLPKIKKISDKRKKTIYARVKEYDLETIGKVLTKVSESDFLNGKNGNGWTANFDWIFNSTNFLKILEDNYKNKPQQQEIKIGRQTLSTIEQNAKGWN